MNRVVASVALALAAPMLFGAAPAPRVADGAYGYELTVNEQPAGSSTIVVRSTTGAFSVDEHVEAGGVTATASSTFDAATLALRTFRIERRDKGVRSAVALAQNGTALTGTQSNGPTLGTSVPPAIANVLVADGLVDELFMLPAVARASGGKGVGFFSLGDGVVVPATLSTPAERPSGIPPSESGIQATIGEETFVVWYNPATLVPDEASVHSTSLIVHLIASHPARH